MPMTPAEFGLLKEAVRWHRAQGGTFFQWPRASIGMLCEWKRWGTPHNPTSRQIDITWVASEPKHLVATADYRNSEFTVLPVTTVTQAIDVLAALGYLPARFSSAYRAGRDEERAGLPRYPEGTPECSAYRAELKTELAKFASGTAPYEYPKGF